MMQVKTGRAYALFQSCSPIGDVRRELNDMKEAAGKPEALAIHAYQTTDASGKGNGTGIPTTITAKAILTDRNYIIMAAWSGSDNERTASALDDVLKVRTEFFIPQNLGIYYSRNGGPNFQCFAGF